jgi:hypothetical protein
MEHSLGQKKPQHVAGVVSLFAVTHQGPAQGGKAGGGEPPASNVANFSTHFKNFLQWSVFHEHPPLRWQNAL